MRDELYPIADGRTVAGQHETVTFERRYLRALVFWACIGVAKSNAGSYGEIIECVVYNFAKQLKMTLPFKPEFNSYKRKIKT